MKLNEKKSKENMRLDEIKEKLQEIMQERKELSTHIMSICFK